MSRPPGGYDWFMRITAHAFFFSLATASFAISDYSLTDPQGMAIHSPDFEYLPGGSHSGAALEMWLTPVVLGNPDIAGFAAHEKQYDSAHGESVFWLRHYIGQSDITHPAVSGEPLLTLPRGFISSLYYKSNFNDLKRIEISPVISGQAKPYVEIASPLTLGGPSLIPENRMDREPSQNWGAPDSTRAFLFPSAESRGLFQSRNWLWGYETSFLSRQFIRPSLSEELSAKTSVAGSQRFKDGNLLLAAEHVRRNSFGAENAIDMANTLRIDSASLLAVYSEGQLSAAGGFAMEKAAGQTNTERDFSDAANQGPYVAPYARESWFAGIHYDHFMGAFQCAQPIRHEGYVEHDKKVLERQTLFGSAVSAQETPDSTYSSLLLRYSPECTGQWNFGWVYVSAKAGVLAEALNSGETFWRASPGLSLQASIGAGSNGSVELYASHAGIPIQPGFAALFADSSGKTVRSSWTDINTNGTIDSGETGADLYRFGGGITSLDSTLKGAEREEVTIAFIRKFNSFFWNTNLTGKYFRNLYLLDYNFEDSYQKTMATVVQTKTSAYARTDDRIGKETYLLTNSDKDAFYLHLEIQGVRKMVNLWFINFSIAHYVMVATPPPGNGMWYNDPGAIDYASADKNGQSHTWARTNYDRGYVSNLLFGRITESWIWTNAIRYRDGEPYGPAMLIDGLTQGVVIAHTEDRAQPLMGMGRHTFALTWDIRLAWRNATTTAGVDVYNLLNSQTEIWEQTLEGSSSRDPLEAIGQRTIRLWARYSL